MTAKKFCRLLTALGASVPPLVASLSVCDALIPAEDVLMVVIDTIGV